MAKKTLSKLRVGITGASGALGTALTKEFRSKGAYVIGFSHKAKAKPTNLNNTEPNKWVTWSCGKEILLKKYLADIDILILNHGINPKGLQGRDDINQSLEINALSTWKLMQIFEDINVNPQETSSNKQVWVNTSEAEIQIAFSPLYEISKHLIGELTSLRRIDAIQNHCNHFEIRKLILGPFKSKLHPFGILNPDFVAKKIIESLDKKSYLIIVTPNPLTYILMPLV